MPWSRFGGGRLVGSSMDATEKPSEVFETVGLKKGVKIICYVKENQSEFLKKQCSRKRFFHRA